MCKINLEIILLYCKMVAPIFNDVGVKKCYTYSRVSSTQQAEQGMSLLDQCQKMRNFIKDNDLICMAEFTDEAVSGAKKYTERSGLNALIMVIKKNELLLVPSLDRLGRSVADLMNICELAKSRGFYLYIMNLNLLYPSVNNVFGDIMISMLGSVASIERTLISERAKSSWNYRKENNLINFKPWFIRETDDKLENYKRDQIRTFVKDLYNDGFSFRWIADYLNKLKLKTGQDKDFYPQSVKQIVDYFIKTGELKKRDVREIIALKK